MACKRIEELFLREEVLVELRRQLYEIARHIGAGEISILAAGEHTVERVTKLVEESATLVVGKESGLGIRRTGEVHHVRDMRTMILLSNHILRLELVHPSACALAIPRVEIAVIHSKEFAFLIEDLISRYFGVIYLNIFVLLEGQAIEFLSQTKHTLLHGFEFEIRTEVVIRNRIACILEFLAIVAEIPWLKGSIKTERIGIFLQVSHFLKSYGHVVVAQLIKEVIYVFLLLSHGIHERLISVTILSEQFSKLQTGIYDFSNNGCVIKLATDSSAVIRHVKLTTDIAIVKILHNRAIGSGLEIKEPTLGITTTLCILLEKCLRVVVQTLQKGFILKKHRPCIGSFEGVLTILKGQLRELGRELLIGLLISR